MIKLLFVDDDTITRRSITENIPWATLGIQLCYVAKDGYEAIQYVLENPVDLVLSDIRMPLLNGIEMAKEMKIIDKHIIFIFLSGFPEFQYAKEALTLNAFDFLTKPISNTKLIEIMQQAVIHIKQESTNKIAISEGVSFVNRNTLVFLLSDTLSEDDKNRIPLIDKNSYSCLLIINYEFNPDNTPTILVLNTLCSTLEKLPYCAVATVRIASQLVLLMHDSTSHNETEFLKKVESTKGQIDSVLNTIDNAHFTVMQGRVIQSEAEISSSYHEAVQGTSDSGFMLSEKIKRFLLENMSDNQLSLSSVAQHFLFNPCYLTVVFKKYNGINIYNYLITLRMERAAELLRNTDQRSYEIATQVGYKDSQYFCNSFRKFFSLTTTEYRKQFKIETDTD